MKVLAREIGMLKQAQRYLPGCPARQNLARIAERQEELETLQAHVGIIARFGAAEIERCEILSQGVA